MVYTIGEMAKKLNIPASTLRFYDKEGLMPFVMRSKSGVRIFTDEDFEWLSVIECLKKTGMPLRDIRQFILMAMNGDESISERYELIVRQKAAVEEQIRELWATLDFLNFKEWYYRKAKESGSTEAIKGLQLSEIPSEFHDTIRKIKGKE